MKRNFKSLLKYLIFILITAFITTVIFKLSKLRNNGVIILKTNIADKQLYYARNTSKIDWHDWEFIRMEKLRTGKTIY